MDRSDRDRTPPQETEAEVARAVIGLEDVRAAEATLRGVAHRTPVLTSRTLDHRTGARLFLKAESFQRTGSFKFRGAYNRAAALTEEERRRGVAAFSSGNHAQAVALAAGLVGTTAVIVMPEDVASNKLEATRAYGAEVVTYDRYGADRERIGRELAVERNLVLIPPYDDPLVMAGQGTTALELLEDVPDLDALLVPVSGGGLIAGCATAATAVRPGIEVLGVEPEGADDTRRSLEAGARVRIPVPRTIADGLQSETPGVLTFPINRRLLAGLVTVSDDEIVEAMRFLFERMRVVVEPSGATALAAALAARVDLRGRRVAVVLSGGNVSPQRLCDLLTR